MGIRTSVESARGCGFRSPGGLYLVSGGLMDSCSRLPIALPVCPACGAGTKPSRGWTWIAPDLLLEGHLGPHEPAAHSGRCPLGAPGRLGERAGLLWIGESFYATPETFSREAAAMGVSRRISAVPRGFEVGKTWVLVAHRKAVLSWAPDATEPDYAPGIFHAFLPEAIEYIVKEDDSEEKLAKLEKKGISLVRVVREEQEVLLA
jgi:hypothetical protein